MKSRLFIAFLLTNALSAWIGQAQDTITVDIRDWQDGRDWLILQGGTVQWEHFDYTVPGLEDAWDEPTWITTTYDGVTNLNNYAWYPSWTNEVGSGVYSSLFTNLAPCLPGQPLANFQLQVLAARSSMSLIQAPSASNAYTTIVEFNDDPINGADYYEALLTYSFDSTTISPILEVDLYAGLLITAPVGSTNRIDYTTDLATGQWLALTNVVITESPFFFCDQDSKGQSRRFYRAVMLP